MNKPSFLHHKDFFVGTGFIFVCALFLLALPMTPRPFAFWPFGFGLIGYLSLSEKPLPDKNLILFLVAMLALSFSSSLWSVNGPESIERASKISGLFLGGVLLLTYIQKADLHAFRKYYWVLPTASFIAFLLLNAERFFDYPVYHLLRPEETKTHHYVLNKASGILVLTFWPILFLGYKHYGYKGVLLLGAAALWFLFFSVSQSSQLAFIITLLFGFLFPYKYKAAWILLAVLITIGVLILPWSVHYAYLHYADLLWQEGLLKESSASMRLEIWDFISKKIFENPLYGYGMEATRYIDDFDSQTRFFPTNTVMHPHSAAFQLWIEFGVIGILLGLCFVLYLLKKIYEAPLQKQQLYLPCLMSILCVSMIGWGLWQSWWIGLLFISAALCLLTSRIIEEDQLFHHETDSGALSKA